MKSSGQSSMKQTGSPSVSPPFLRPGLAAVSFWVEMLWAVGFCGGRDHFNFWPSSSQPSTACKSTVFDKIIF